MYMKLLEVFRLAMFKSETEKRNGAAPNYTLCVTVFSNSKQLSIVLWH